MTVHNVNTRTREQLEQRLRELESETESQEPEESEPLFTAKNKGGGGSPFDPLPENWRELYPPEPSYVTEKDVADNSVGFTIGQVYDGGDGWAHLLIQALPKPTYRDIGAKAGDPTTNTLMLEHARLDGEWYHTCRDLENCIGWTRQKLITQGELGTDLCAWLNRHIETWEESDEKRYFEQTWPFLLRLWAGRKMTPVSERQLEKWAREGWRPNRDKYEAEQKRKKESANAEG